MVDFSELPRLSEADKRRKRMAKSLVNDLTAVRCRDVVYDGSRARITGLPGGGVLTVTGQVRGAWTLPQLRKLEEETVTGWTGQAKNLGDGNVYVIIPQDSFIELMARLAGREAEADE